MMKPEETPHPRLEVEKVEGAHMSFTIMDDKQCSDRALEAICVQDVRRYWVAIDIVLRAEDASSVIGSSIRGTVIGGVRSRRPTYFLQNGFAAS